MYYTTLTCLRVDFAHPTTLAGELASQIRRSGRPVFAVIYKSEVSAADGYVPAEGAWGLGGKWTKAGAPWPDGPTIWEWQASNTAHAGMTSRQ
jgi:hypothetical protein